MCSKPSFILILSDIDDEVQSLKEFSTEAIVACSVRCVKTILGDVDLPNSLPTAMSARFRIGTSLATHLQVGLIEPDFKISM